MYANNTLLREHMNLIWSMHAFRRSFGMNGEQNLFALVNTLTFFCFLLTGGKSFIGDIH